PHLAVYGSNGLKRSMTRLCLCVMANFLIFLFEYVTIKENVFLIIIALTYEQTLKRKLTLDLSSESTLKNHCKPHKHWTKCHYMHFVLILLFKDSMETFDTK